MRFVKYLLVFTLFSVASNLGFGQKWYVSTSGSNSNSGSSTYPLETVQAAIDSSSNGDTIVIKEGTYSENLNLPNHKITIGSLWLDDGAESHISKTIIDGSGYFGNNPLFNTTTDIFHVIGLTISGAPKQVFQTWNKNGSSIRKCVIYQCGNNSIWGVVALYGNTLLDSCTFDENYGRYIVSNNGGQAGILQVTSRCTFKNNGLTTQNGGGYASIFSEGRIVIRSCLFYNNNSACIATGGNGNVDSAVIINNTIVNNKSYGITFENWGGGTLNILINNIIQGNKYNMAFNNSGYSVLLMRNNFIYPYLSGSYSYPSKFNFKLTNYGQDTSTVLSLNSDFSLPNFSPGLAYGYTSSFLKKDIKNKNQPTPSGTSPDVGAFENTAGFSSPYITRADGGEKQANLTWTQTSFSGLKYFKIYRSKNPISDTATVGVIVDTLWSGRTTYKDSGLTNLTKYYYRMKSINSSGLESGMSNQVEVRPNTPPNAPDSLKVENGPRMVRLSWKASTSGSVKYRIYRGTSANNLQVLVDTTSKLNYIDLGLTAWKPYYYAIRAIDTVGVPSKFTQTKIGLPNNIWWVSTTGNDGNSGAPWSALKTIPKGISYAQSSSHDTVYVLAGTYKTNFNLSGKDVAVIGYEGASKTKLEPASSSPILQYNSNEPKTSLVQGFTFQNGTEAVWVSPGGGGIVRNCIMTNFKNGNAVIGTHYGSVKFENCLIYGNDNYLFNFDYKDTSSGQGNSFINCTISSDDYYPMMRNNGYGNGVIAFHNCILENNYTVSSLMGGNHIMVNCLTNDSVYGKQSKNYYLSSFAGVFENVSQSNYALSNSSKALGLGTSQIYVWGNRKSTAPKVDLNNNPRPNPSGSNPDLGAYENASAFPGPRIMNAVAGEKKVDLTWTQASFTGLKYLKIYRSTSPISDTATVGVIVDTLWSGRTTYKDSGLTNLTKYYYRMKSVNSSGLESGMSNQVEVRPNTPPNAPDSIQFDFGPRVIDVKWSKSSSGSVTRYALYRKTLGVETLLTSSNSSRTYRDSGLVSGQKYEYRVYAIDSVGVWSLKSKNGSAYANSLWYVSTSGNNSNLGSKKSPLGSIATAFTKAWAGDTVVLLDGTYKERINFTNKTLHLASEYAIDRNTSHISSTHLNGLWTSNNLIYDNNITNGYGYRSITGLTIDSTKGSALYMGRIVLDHVVFNGIRNSNIANLWYGVLKNCQFVNSCTWTGNVNPLMMWDSCSVEDCLFDNLVFHDRILHVTLPQYKEVSFKRNTFINNKPMTSWNRMVWVEGNGKMTFANNLIIDKSSNQAYGFHWSGNASTDTVYIQNNTIVGGRIALWINANGIGNVVVENNLFAPYSTGPYNGIGNEYSRFVYLDGNGSGTVWMRFRNNHFDTTGGFALKLIPNIGLIDTTGSKNNWGGKIDFKDPANNDYSLTSQSKDLGAGVAISSYYVGKFDVKGKARVQPSTTNPDLGAIENSGAFPSPVIVSAEGGEKKATLTWSQSSFTGLKYFKIYRSKNPISDTATVGVIVDTLWSGRTTYKDSGLTNLTKNYYRMKSVNSSGLESGMSNQVEVRPNTPPNAPDSIKVVNGPHRVQLTWPTSTSTSVKYTVLRTAAGQSDFKISGLTSTSYEDTTVKDGVIYTYKVAAVDSVQVRSLYTKEKKGYARNIWFVSSQGKDSIGQGYEMKPTKTIQYAINRSHNGDTVLLEKGTYKENIVYNGHQIVVTSRYSLTGNMAYRDSTIIDGNKAGCVVRIKDGEGKGTELSGLIIQNGYSNAGAGIYATANQIKFQSLIVRNNTAAGDIDGGGAYIMWGKIRVENCEFYGNKGRKGGAIALGGNTTDTAWIVNCDFHDNDAWEAGSAFHFVSGNPNKVFVYNTIIHDEDGQSTIWCQTPVVRFVNSTIVNNTPLNTTPVNYMYTGTLEFYNCIIRNPGKTEFGSVVGSNPGTITVQYSNVRGGYSGTGNTDADPGFTPNSYKLNNASSSIGKGGTKYTVSKDRDGNPRPNPSGSNPDLGAYENSAAFPGPVISTCEGGEKKATLTWSQSSFTGLKYFKIYRSTSPISDTATVGVVVDTLWSGRTTYKDSGLTNLTKYYYRMKSINSSGLESGMSNQVEVRPNTPPNAPDSLKVENGPRMVRLSWKASTSGSVKYRIYRGTSANNLQVLVDTTSKLNYVDQGLTAWKPYYYAIRAIDTVGVPSKFTSTKIGLPNNIWWADTISNDGNLGFKSSGISYTQTEVDALNVGDTLILIASTYTNPIVIKKSLTIGSEVLFSKSWNPDVVKNTIIDGMSKGVMVKANQNTYSKIRIIGLTFDNCQSGAIEMSSIDSFNRSKIFGCRFINSGNNSSYLINLYGNMAVDSCYFYNNIGNALIIGNHQGTGMIRATRNVFEKNGNTNKSTSLIYFYWRGAAIGNIAFNNIGAALGGSCNGPGDTIVVENNTFVRNTYGLYFDHCYGGFIGLIRNNIIENNSDNCILLISNTGTGFSRLWFINNKLDKNTIYTNNPTQYDCKLINCDTSSKYYFTYPISGLTDLKLKSYSLAIGGGVKTNYYLNKRDLFNTSRPTPSNSNTDLGAIESEFSFQSPIITSAEGGEKKATLTWTQSSFSGLKYFKIYRSKNPISDTATVGVIVDTLWSGRTTYKDSGLTNLTKYYYRMKSINSSGLESGMSNQVEVRPNTPPNAPDSLKVENGPRMVRLSWKASTSGSVKYRIYRGTSANNLQVLVDTTSKLNYIDQGLTAWKPYYYAIRAIDTVGVPSKFTSTKIGLPNNIWWVSTTGDDGNSGAPWSLLKTITKGISYAQSSSHDTVYVLAGTYKTNFKLNSDDIAIIGYEGAEKTILEPNNNSNYILRLESYEPRTTLIKGFTFQKAQQAINCEGASKATISNCIVTDCNGTGGFIHGHGGGVRFENMLIHNNPGRVFYFDYKDTANGLGIYFINSTIVDNNEFGGTSWNYGPGNIVFANCVVWDTKKDSVNIPQQANYIFKNSNVKNAFYSNQTGNYRMDPGFANPGQKNYALSNSSGLIGMGKDQITLWGTRTTAAPKVDLNNNPRPNPSGSNPDLGAFENSAAFPSPVIVSAEGGEKKATLTWTQSSFTGLKYFKIYRSKNPISDTATVGVIVDTLWSGRTTYKDSGLTNLTKYYYRMKSVNSSGLESGMSNQVEVRPNTPPNAPSNGVFVPGPHMVGMKWKPSTSKPVSYVVYRSSKTEPMAIRANHMDTLFIDDQTQDWKGYTYRIHAMDSVGVKSIGFVEIKAYANKIWFIDTAGNDSAAYKGHPWYPAKNYQKLVDNTKFISGDTILLKKGTYKSNFDIAHSNGNYSYKDITMGSLYMLNGDTNAIAKTILDGSSYYGNNAFIAVGQTKFNLIGVTIYKTNAGALNYNSAHKALSTVKRVRFLNCGNSTVWGTIAIWGYVRIDSCEFIASKGRYLVAQGSSTSIIRNSTFVNNGFNQTQDCGVIFSERGGQVYNNIFTGNGMPALVLGGNASLDTVQWIHNTIYKNNSYGLYFQNWGGGNIAYIENNIVEGNKPNVYFNNSGFSYLFFSNNFIKPFLGDSSVNKNAYPMPLYYKFSQSNIDSISRSYLPSTVKKSSDLKLGAYSPLLGMGKNTSIKTDMLGSMRPNPSGSSPDLGALEAGYELPGPFIDSVRTLGDTVFTYVTVLRPDKSTYLYTRYYDTSGAQKGLDSTKLSASKKAYVVKNFNLSNGRLYSVQSDLNKSTIGKSNVRKVAIMVKPDMYSPTNQATMVDTAKSLKWWSSPYAQKYRVQLSSSSSFASTLLDKVVSVDSVKPSGLKLNRTYYWRAMAIDSQGRSLWSNAFSYQTEIQKARIDSLRYSPNVVKVYFSVQDTFNVKKFYVYRDTSANAFDLIDSVSGTSRVFIDSFAQPGNRYYYRLKIANRQNVVGNFGKERALNVLVRPVLQLPVDEQDSVSWNKQLVWTKSKQAQRSEFELYRIEASSTQISKQVLSKDTVAISGMKQNRYHVWRVRSLDSCGRSEWSDTFRFQTEVASTKINAVKSYPAHIDIAWAAADTFNLKDYLVYRDTQSGALVLLDSVSYLTTSYRDTSLVAGKRYYYQIRVRNRQGSISQPSLMRSASVLEAPILVKPEMAKTNVTRSPMHDWNKVKYATKYRIQVSTDSNFVTTLVNSLQTPDSLALSGLKYSTYYYWKVRAEDSTGYGTWSTRFVYQTQVQTPVLTSLSSKGTQVEVKWTLADTTNAGMFVIYRDTVANPTTAIDSVYSWQRNYFDNSSQQDTRYYYRVALKNKQNVFGPKSNQKAINVMIKASIAMPLDKELNVSVAPLFDWDSERFANRYRIQVSQDSKFGNTVKDTTNTYSSATLATFKKNTNYYWRVRCEDSLGYGLWSDTFMYQTELDVPVLFTLSTTHKAIKLNWKLYDTTNYANLQGFYIYRDTSSDASTLIDSVGKGISTYTDTGVLLATMNYYRIKAYNKQYVKSDYSNEKRAAALHYPNLISPSDTAKKIPLATSLKWTKERYATKYRIQASYDSAVSNPFFDKTLNSVDSTLISLSRWNYFYYYRVQAQDSLGISRWSDIFEFQSKLYKPTIDTTIAGNKKIRIYWQRSDTQNIKEYKIYRDTTSNNPKYIATVKSVDGKTNYSYLDSGLKNFKSYYYWVSAVNNQHVESEKSAVRFNTTFNISPFAHDNKDTLFESVGRNSRVKRYFLQTQAYDKDGWIDSIVWYIDDIRVSQDDSLKYKFRQGTTKVRAVVWDNDQATDTNTFFVSQLTYKKKFRTGIIAGVSVFSENEIYVADTSLNSFNLGEVLRIDTLGNTTFNYLVSDRIRTTPSFDYNGNMFLTNGVNLNSFTNSGSPLFPEMAMGGLSFVTPTVDSVLGRVYVGVSNRKLFAIDVDNGGKIKWDFTADAPMAAPAVVTAGRKLIFPDVSGKLYGFDVTYSYNPKTGDAPKWKWSGSDSIMLAPAIDTLENIIVGTTTGKLLKLEFDSSGNINTKWSKNLGSKVTTSAVLDAYGHIYVGCQNGKLYCLKSSNGDTLWSFATGAPILSTPTLSDQNRIYVANMKGHVYALDTGKKIMWYYLGKEPVQSHLVHVNGATYIPTLGGSLQAIYDAGITNDISTIKGQVTPRGNMLEVPKPIWGTYQGNYRRTGLQDGIFKVIPDKPADQNSVTVYPNPSAIEFRLESLFGVRTIEFMDMSGRTVEVRSLGLATQSTIDVRDIRAGVYFLKVNTEKGVVTKRIVITH